MSKILESLNRDIKFSNDDFTMEVVKEYIPNNFYGNIYDAEHNLTALLTIDKELSNAAARYPQFDIEGSCFLYYDSFTQQIRFADFSLHGKSIDISYNRVVIGSAGFPMSELENHFGQYINGLIEEHFELFQDESEYTETQDNYALFGVSRYNFI